MITFDQERSADRAAIELLLDQAFGLARSEKSTYKVRFAANYLSDLSMVARLEDTVVASVRFWSVEIFDMIGDRNVPALLLGPLAVAPEVRGQGVGTALMRRTLKVLDMGGFERVVLVGDIDYYSRFAFERVLPRYITMPCGNDADRLLVRQRKDTLRNLPVVGKVRAAGFSHNSDFAA